MEEIWRDIPGWEKKYAISTKQNIKNIETGKIIHKQNYNSGYDFVFLHMDGKRKKEYVHKLVAITYPELVQNEYFEGAEIDHINTIRTDNRPENLRWVNRSQNMFNPETRKKRINNKRMSKWVIKLSKNNEILHFYPSTAQAERETGVKNGNISKCCNGKTPSAGGYIWKYAE